MSINIFFTVIALLLIGMYGYFKPSYLVHQDAREVPKLELEAFTLYEISHKGVDHVLEAKNGKEFEDRYEVTSAKFSDNTKRLFQTVSADQAKYKDDLITLRGNVNFVREDGLKFVSDEGKYNTKSSLIHTEGPFVITQNHNRVEGTKLDYNTNQDTVNAYKVSGSYQLN
ncbi:MAG: LPS export ABC transporter periplasmic protein LptC [Sulfuricurvum sp.]|nr:LPS export ABC transporter periplasmic protein LptC [Sulfuricurvum sp.]